MLRRPASDPLRTRSPAAETPVEPEKPLAGIRSYADLVAAVGRTEARARGEALAQLHRGGGNALVASVLRQGATAEAAHTRRPPAATPAVLLAELTRRIHSEGLVRFQQALDAVDEAGVTAAGDLILALWANVEGSEVALVDPGGKPLPEYEGARVAILNGLGVQTYQGEPTVARQPLLPQADDVGAFIFEQTRQVAWLVKDTAALAALLGRGDLAEAQQWEAVGLLRQHQNPWHFAYMDAVVHLQSAFGRFGEAPRRALSELREANAWLFTVRGVGTADRLGSLELAPAEGKVRLLEPLSVEELCQELYDSPDWKKLLLPYNRGLLERLTAERTWIPPGTEILVEPTRLAPRHRGFFLAATAARDQLREQSPKPFIRAEPETTAVVGNTVKYTLWWTAGLTKPAEFQWSIWWDPGLNYGGENDGTSGPSGRLEPIFVDIGPDLPDYGHYPQIVESPVASEPWELWIPAVGNHDVQCVVTTSEGETYDLHYTQVVTTVGEKLDIGFGRDIDWRIPPDKLLEQLHHQRETIFGDREKERLDKQIADLEEVKRDREESGGMRPLKALWVSSEEAPVTLPLVLFIAPEPDDDGHARHVKLKLWDFTLEKVRTQTESGDGVNDALDTLLEEFADDAPYPDGVVRVEFNAGTLPLPGVERRQADYETDGGTSLDKILRGLSAAALAVGAVAAVLGQEEIAVPMFSVSGMLAGAGAVADLANKLEHGEFEWDLAAGMDLLDVAAALLTAGVSRTVTAGVRGVGEVTFAARLTKMVGYAQIGILAGAHLEDIAKAVDSGDPEKVKKALLHALADGALFVVVHRATAQLGTEPAMRPEPGVVDPGPRATAAGTVKGGLPPEQAPAPRHEGPEPEPGSPAAHRLAHEAWADRIRREGLPPREPAPDGPPLPPKSTVPTDAPITSPDQAREVYDRSVARAGDNEVGIFRSKRTGEYVVRVGDPHSVSAPPATRAGAVEWETVLHRHSNRGNVLTQRMPAPHDVQETGIASMRAGRPITEFVEFDVPGRGRGSVAYTVDAKARTITIDWTDSAGRPQQRTFHGEKFLHEYAAHYDERTRFIDPQSDEYAWMMRDLKDYYENRSPGDGPTMSGTLRGGGVPPPPDAPKSEEGPVEPPSVKPAATVPAEAKSNVAQGSVDIAAANAGKAHARLERLLKEHDLTDPMFEGLDQQTAGKVSGALDGAFKDAPTSRKAANDWAREGAAGNPREFANRLEYAKAYYNELRAIAAAKVAGKPFAKKLATEAAAVEMGSQAGFKTMVDRFEADIAVSRSLGPGEGIPEDVVAGGSADRIVEELRKLDRIGYESEAAEAYHARKHPLPAAELARLHGKSPVEAAAESSKKTIRDGTLAKPPDKMTDGSWKLVFHRELGEAGTPQVFEAIVYIKPNGHVDIASYGPPKEVPR